MTSFTRSGGIWLRFSALLGLLLLACDDAPGGGGHGSAGGGAAGEPSALEAEAGAPTDDPKTPEGARYVGLSDSFTPFFLGEGSGGEGGATGPELPLGPPHGTSTTCGDAIVGDDEECDDGAGGADGCTAECQTQDQPGGPPSATPDATNDRYLGAGRHPVSGLEHGFITTYVDAAGDEPAIGARLFNIWGQPAHDVTVSEGASPIYEANPVAAALPGGRYAVAWGDFDGDGSDLGVALRLVDEDGTLGSLHVANAATEFSQLNPDVLWTGSELVVAWEDYSDALNGPDLRFRTFNEDLDATSSDGTLAEGVLPEAAVALAPFNGGWVAAYREGLADGRENVVVKVGQAVFRVGPVQGGPIDDRPSLVELDDTHLLVVFSEGTDPETTGIYNVPRLRFAVVDTEGPTQVLPRGLNPLDDVFLLEKQVAQQNPGAVAAEGGAYVTWRSEARPGDAAGDQIWLKHVRWQPEALETVGLENPELLIPRVCEGSVGDQRAPALAPVALPPHGALAIAWTDYARALGPNSGEPDVAVHYAPLRPQGVADPVTITEEWTGATAATWPARWTHEITTTGTAQTTISGNEGRLLSIGSTLNGLSVVNDHTALDVELKAQFRFNLNQARGGFFMRRTDAQPQTYLVARFGSALSDPFRIYSVQNNVLLEELATVNQPPNFQYWSQDLEFWFKARVTNTGDGGIQLAAKVWLVSLPEPVDWTVQATALPGSLTANLFANRVGRFGLYSNHGLANRETRFDHFRATFFEGGQLGDPADAMPPTLPREPASFAEACCVSDAECAGDTSCQSGRGEEVGLGSHAAICVASHCENELHDADEVRANCGGQDCAVCGCTSTALPGADNYCSATCLCGRGQGDCDGDAECVGDLLCSPDNGPKYDLPQTWEACAPSHCVNRVKDEAQGETDVDCGGPCGRCDVCGAANGSYWHCRVWCKCASGNGTCQYDDECVPGTVCGSTKTGSRYGLPSSTRACVKPHCDNNAYEPALGETSKDCGGECGCGGTCPACPP